MTIRVPAGSGRRFAWTDRTSGFLDLHADLCGEGLHTGGYVRGNTTCLCDFFLCEEGYADIWRSNALWTDVRPEGCRIHFPESGPGRKPLPDLEISLLLDEQALFVSLSGADGVYPGLLFPEGSTVSRAGHMDSGAWKEVPGTGVFVWSDGFGRAMASEFPFTLDVPDRRTCIVRHGHPQATDFSVYIVFEDTCEGAERKAVRLARDRGIFNHREKIEAFLDSCAIFTGDARFDSAVRWAHFTGWMMVCSRQPAHPLLWAALPWQRESWGRDTCVSLAGTLLAGGQFGEGRQVLSGLAHHQCRDASSPHYGRIPNCVYRDGRTIYNSADASLLFVRSVWEYIQYTGDLGLADELAPALDVIIDSSCARCDSRGFLIHGDSETWMDTEIDGSIAWTPRGDRACEIQALWYTALRIAVRFARREGDAIKMRQRDELSMRLRQSFRALFWCGDRNALADHLPPGPTGEWLKDFRVRPNQLFAITASSILDEEEWLLDAPLREAIMETVNRELINPHGLYTLSPDDPLFHPFHEESPRHHKDVSVHNGTIAPWLTGAYIEASVSLPATRHAACLPVSADALLRNTARQILEIGVPGTLSGSIQARSIDGEPLCTGAYSRTWGLAEFIRVLWQQVTGFAPRLDEHRIVFAPHLPARVDNWSAVAVFGPGWKMDISIVRERPSVLKSTLVWTAEGDSLPLLEVNGHSIIPGVPLTVWTGSSAGQQAQFSHVLPRNLFPEHWIVDAFPPHELDNPWCGALHQDRYLESLLRAGKLRAHHGGGTNAAALEWFFDGDHFRSSLPASGLQGARWTATHTDFALWAPTARSVTLVLYRDGSSGEACAWHPMTRLSDSLVWVHTLEGDLHGMYYRYRVLVHGVVRETADPFALASGVNGERSMVLDPRMTDPSGWENVRPPSLARPNEAVIYELHVADATSSPSWTGSESLRRTYRGLVEKGTYRESSSGRVVPTGFDHFRSLGITHVQLLPVADFTSVDETRCNDASYAGQLRGGLFNWGYDPWSHRVPEGSYATNPWNGCVRIRELKELIKAFADSGIGVILDVVFNHVPDAPRHPLSVCVPGYYFRLDSYSGAGDDTASERPAFRTYMIDSLVWWLREYRVAGFRFDLMGLHDIATMNAIAGALCAIKSDVLLYGEGWLMYHGHKMVGAAMTESRKLPAYGFFNDAFRCAVKGSSFWAEEGGYVHDGRRLESVKFGLVGTMYHPEVHNRLVEGTVNCNPWGTRTGVSVNYTEVHDNFTLYDKLSLVEQGKSEAWYERLQRMAIALVLFSQGIPLLHAGMEFMRTKEIPSDIMAEHSSALCDVAWTHDKSRAFCHNSYTLCDRLNGLDWTRCADKQELVQYVRALIEVRKSHPLFLLETAEEVLHHVRFSDVAVRSAPLQPLPLAWILAGGKDLGDSWDRACIVVNPGFEDAWALLPASAPDMAWHPVLDARRPGDPSGRESVIPPKTLYLYAEF